MRIQTIHLAKFNCLQTINRRTLRVVSSFPLDTLRKSHPLHATKRRLLSTRSPSSVHHAILRVHGPDSKGVVAAVSNVLDQFGCAITQSEQWTDTLESMFFERLQFSNYDTPFSDTQRRDISHALNRVCQGFSLQHDVNWRLAPRRVVIFVSKYDHCLWELLLRHEAQELDCDIVAVVSNHESLRPVADTFEIPYHFIPVTPENKDTQEHKQLDLLQDLRVDLLVLARYMQVLSPLFLRQFTFDRIINIHHSFLPAFAGGSPYQQAYRRGVKLIGATAHYVTHDLDDGPIIEQDVLHVSHRDTPALMRQKGRIIERNVLVKAVRAHLDDRVIPYQNRCVVFGD